MIDDNEVLKLDWFVILKQHILKVNFDQKMTVYEIIEIKETTGLHLRKNDAIMTRCA